MSAHRTRQVPRTPFMARVAFLGVAAVGLLYFQRSQRAFADYI